MKKLKSIYKVLVYVSLGSLVVSILITFLQNDDLNYLILCKSAEFGTYLLFLMLLVKSVYIILRNKKVNNKLYQFLRYNNKYQREQGLIIFNIIFIHIAMFSITNISSLKILFFYYISAIIPMVVLIYMELTSFKFLQTKIKRWKKHHSIIWLTIPFIYVHVLLVSPHQLRYLAFIVIIYLIAIIELFTEWKRGVKHITYLIVGFGLSICQVALTNQYLTFQNSKTQIDSSVATEEIVNDSDLEKEESTNTVYNDGVYTGDGYGHRGLIEVETTIEDDQIIDIEVVVENEDESWWEPVIDTLPAEVMENNSTDGVGYVAGSTHSSKGFLDAVEDSLQDARI